MAAAPRDRCPSAHTADRWGVTSMRTGASGADLDRTGRSGTWPGASCWPMLRRRTCGSSRICLHPRRPRPAWYPPGALAVAASRNGVTRFVADVLGENARARAMLDRAGPRWTPERFGVVHGVPPCRNRAASGSPRRRPWLSRPWWTRSSCAVADRRRPSRITQPTPGRRPEGGQHLRRFGRLRVTKDIDDVSRGERFLPSGPGRPTTRSRRHDGRPAA